MYSLVMMAAMTAAPDVPQEFLCHVNPSRYGGGPWLKHCFFDCCLPARYGWVNCWNKGFGYYPGASRGFCGSCVASYGHFYNAPACCGSTCGYGGPSCGTGSCGRGYGFGGSHGGLLKFHGLNDWGIGCKPAYWTNVAGCPPHVTCPPYAYYTQKNPCCTYGHFAFDSGLIGHSAGIGYAGFGGYGNFGFYGAVSVQHPPTVADIPRYQPQDFQHYEPRPYVPSREYVAPGYVPAPFSGNPMSVPEAPEVPKSPGSLLPTPAPRTNEIPPIVNPLPSTPLVPPTPGLNPTPLNTPEVPKAPTFPPIPPLPGTEAPKKEEPAPKKDTNKTLSIQSAPATVVLSVPEGAKVFVEGVQLKSTSAERTFRTPALVPGQEYAYTVKAVVEQDGQEYTEALRVVVIPGQTTNASFGKLIARFGSTPSVVQTSK